MLDFNPPRYLFHRQEILNYIQDGENFLEVGTGNIKLGRSLLAYFERVILVDFSEFVQDFFNQLPTEHKQKLKLMIGDINDLTLQETFNCIVSCEVMEHIDNDEAFLRRLHSLLKENGQILLSVPSRMKYWSIHDDIVGHLRRYEKNDIVDLFNKTGFSDIKVISYGFPFLNFLRVLRITLA